MVNVLALYFSCFWRTPISARPVYRLVFQACNIVEIYLLTLIPTGPTQKVFFKTSVVFENTGHSPFQDSLDVSGCIFYDCLLFILTFSFCSKIPYTVCCLLPMMQYCMLNKQSPTHTHSSSSNNNGCLPDRLGRGAVHLHLSSLMPFTDLDSRSLEWCEMALKLFTLCTNFLMAY